MGMVYSSRQSLEAGLQHAHHQGLMQGCWNCRLVQPQRPGACRKAQEAGVCCTSLARLDWQQSISTGRRRWLRHDAVMIDDRMVSIHTWLEVWPLTDKRLAPRGPLTQGEAPTRQPYRGLG